MRANIPNHFLANLPASDQELLRSHLIAVDLAQGDVLFRQGNTMSRIYFPTAGVVSLVVDMSDGTSVEAGMVGCNGVVAGASALDGKIAINTAIVQVEGSGSAVHTSVLERLADESPTMRRRLVAHERAISAHTQQVAACNAVHDLEHRLARWLLQVRDLTGSEELPLTQEFLSQMLGVQRTSVTLIARHLQSAGLIRYRRGHIHILDVEGLGDTACECYPAINGFLDQLTGWRAREGMISH